MPFEKNNASQAIVVRQVGY